jgi:adenylylsulfate kinase
MHELRTLYQPRDGVVIWMTGLSGAGKSTLGDALHARLAKAGLPSIVLDGDALRRGLNADLGYEKTDRTENIRRIAHVAALFKQQKFIVIAAVISPEHQHRRVAREVVGHGFVEVYVSAPLSVCEARDTKGLYARARRGEIPNFTGVSAPYQEPTDPDVYLDTNVLTVDAAIRRLIVHLVASRLVPKGLLARARSNRRSNAKGWRDRAPLLVSTRNGGNF